MRAMSAANLSSVLDRIESLAPRLSNRLQRANTLVETLSTFQVPSQRLKLEDSPPRSLMNRHDSDGLLDGLLDPSVSNEEGAFGSASTKRVVDNDISPAHRTPASLRDIDFHQHSKGPAECVIDTDPPLPSLQLPPSAREGFSRLFSGNK
jgi:hypothetical protein